VTLFQLRVTRWTTRIEPRTKIGAGLLLMAGSFLLLPLDTSLPTLVLVAIVFVAGEMLWAPASQALRAELAPSHLRGAYLGALAASTFVANGLTPALGFRLGEAAGETATWVALLGASATAAALYALVCRGRPADATESAREPAVAA
jgi:MFS family permease